MAAVLQAAERNDLHALARLLDAHPALVEAEQRDYPFARPLHSVCLAGSLEAVRLLLERGAGLESRNAAGETPLMWACEGGQARVVSFLLGRGAQPGKRTPSSWWTTLMLAAYGEERRGSDHVAVIRLLLQDGRVGVSAWNKHGWTALCFACHHGHVARARALLVEGRADLGFSWRKVVGPLFAYHGTRWNCVQLLRVSRQQQRMAAVGL